jgi:rubrerythrin
MGSPRGNLARYYNDDYDDFDDLHRNFERTGRRSRNEEEDTGRRRALRREQPSEAFKCRRCKAFIGAPPSGGRHRNHCPSCLWSLHVDHKTPGDRASECRSLMEPVGSLARLNGEQAVVHRCRACGIERHCRVAADDSPLLLMKLPLVAPDLSVQGIPLNRAGAA